VEFSVLRFDDKGLNGWARVCQVVEWVVVDLRKQNVAHETGYLFRSCFGWGLETVKTTRPRGNWDVCLAKWGWILGIPRVKVWRLRERLAETRIKAEYGAKVQLRCITGSEPHELLSLTRKEKESVERSRQASNLMRIWR
jgi:hypothetical protein